uniref:CASP-like protein n=1 Tax=Oryza nivara TaxID=4536 RepID=A0A0E0J8J0_ORYNI
MAEAHVVAICVAVAALALAAAVLGVVGEATKSKAPPSSRSNTRYSYGRYDGVNCVYRRTPALLATVSAAAFVVGAFRSQSGERRRREDGVETYYRCTVLVAGMFAGASSLAFLAAFVGIAS